MIVLGIHSGVTINQHDPNAVLIKDGHVIAACEEERFLRIKGARGHLCLNSITKCLQLGNISIHDVDLVAHPGRTYADMPSRIEAYMRHHFGFSPPILMIEHQLAHISGAYHSSGFVNAIGLSYDGYGDRLSGALANCEKGQIDIIETLPHDNSLGTFYAAMTSFLGFTPEEDEYKVMGLAAFGEEGVNLSDLIKIRNAEFQVNETLFHRDDIAAPTMYEPYYNQALIDLLGPPRLPGAKIEKRHKDIAFAVQSLVESCAILLVEELYKRCGHKDLCLSGGVALNCAVNRRLAELPTVERLYVLPPASDRGLALGCAFEGAKHIGSRVHPPTDMYLGPEYGLEDIREELSVFNGSYVQTETPEKEAATMIAEGKVVGWFQGRSEYGPRALGNRSIIADPRNEKMRDIVNARIKFRENFRPFAPAILEERASEVFELSTLSPYMTRTVKVRDNWKSRIAAVTHTDGTARVQTVSSTTAPRFHKLIQEFEICTGVPVVLNTSFNLRGEPIVETPRDAIRTFVSSGLDALILEDFIIQKPFSASHYGSVLSGAKT